MRRLLRSHSAALALSLDGKIKPTIAFLRDELGVSALGRVLSSQPAILSLSVEANLRPKCTYLQELGMTPMGTLLTQYPAIMTLSLEKNLKPTAEALTHAGVLRPPDVSLRPRHLAASLDCRIIPRLTFCADRNVTPSLGAATTSSDDDFCKQVGCDRREWDAHVIDMRRGGDGESALSIPWLPEGLDLTAMLFAEVGGEGEAAIEGPTARWAKPPRLAREAAGETPAGPPMVGHKGAAMAPSDGLAQSSERVGLGPFCTRESQPRAARRGSGRRPRGRHVDRKADAPQTNSFGIEFVFEQKE